MRIVDVQDKPVLVYRVCDSRGMGAYSGWPKSLVGIAEDESGHTDWYHYHSPAPWDDGFLRELPTDGLFGFGSERQMFRWFPPIWWREFKRHQGMVHLWSVPESFLMRGHNQVVFIPARSKLLDIIPCAVFKIGVQ